MKRLLALVLAGCAATVNLGSYDEESVLARHPGLRGSIVLAPAYVPGKTPDPLPDKWVTADDRRLSAGERIRVTVENDPGYDRNVLIRPDGKVAFSKLGDLTCGGRTIRELREELQSKYKPFFQQPRLDVAVAESGDAVGVDVVGMVNFNGTLREPLPRDLKAAVSLANGLTRSVCLPQILVLRPSEKKVIVCDWYQLSHGDEKQNLPLRAGDVVVATENYPETVPCAAEWAPLERFFKGELDRDGLVKALRRR